MEISPLGSIDLSFQIQDLPQVLDQIARNIKVSILEEMQETFNNRQQDSIKQSQSSNERIILNQMNTRTTQIQIQYITIKVLDYINPRNKIELLKHHRERERDKRRNHDKTK